MGSKVHDVPLAKEMPPGDVRGFDVRAGKQLWQFRSIPGEGEFGNETWEQGSWKTTGAANVWTMMSADEALGYVYLPFSTPSNDFFGGQRPGNGLFGESLGQPWMRAPASASGTFRWPIMGYGTMTFLRPPT